jgi:putative membrane protein
MRTSSMIGFLVGLAALTAMVAWQGAATVAAGLASAGWGVLLLVVVYVPHLLLSTASWRLLFAAGRGPRFHQALYAKWIGASVNSLLPVANIGGELVKVRLLTWHAVRGTDAGASVVVDKTVQAISVLLWVMIGLCLLVSLTADVDAIVAVLSGFAVAAVGIGAFLALQRAGALSRLVGAVARTTGSPRLARAAAEAARLDSTIRALYDRPARIVLAVVLRLMGRVVLAGEVWLAATLMGHSITLLEAVTLRSLAAAARSAAFAVPGGLGAQEAGYMAFGALIGLPPQLMLSVSLATRVRELVVGLSGLVAWQHAEGRGLIARNGLRSGRPSD